MFLSQRPNNDPQQWQHRVTGKRFPDPYEAGTEAGLCDDNPRPEFTQTRDPLPWIDARGIRWADSRVTNVTWSPRHEEFDTPVNRVLAAFRSHYWSFRPENAEAWLKDMNEGDGYGFDATLSATDAEVEHARRVLSKLTAVYA